jgi:ATP-dependent HslUV protease ATP-binding subunit HslU
VRDLTPRKIVEALDKYIVGQKEAKRAVAIAIRNRWRRLQLSDEMREEVMPKNIIMIGPTGVGKTEIARRIAGLVKAPFLKVEASKYTEVGYHGRDVESMIRDIVEIAVNMVRTEQMEKVDVKAENNTEERLLDLLLPLPEKKEEENVVVGEGEGEVGDTEKKVVVAEKQETTREKFRSKLRAGKLEDRMVEIKTQEKPVVMQGIIAGIEEIGVDFQNVIEKMIPPKTQVKKTPISEARKILKQEEAEKLIDKEKVIKDALDLAENMGIIFIDEIDKVASRESGHGPDISREGVQRDILPIVEGSTVVTRYGMVKTDRILFIAAGAFHVSKPSDLIPELQGRFPIRVELKELGKEEFIRILTEPKNALIKQYTELLKTEEIKLEFKKDAIDEITDMAVKINKRSQSIGARRLHTVMEKLLEDVSFDAPDMKDKNIVVDAEYVCDKMKDIVKDEDLTKYIL